MVTYVAALALIVGLAANIQPVSAATMTHASTMEYNMNASGASSVAIAFTAGASDIAGSLTVNFGSWGGTVNATQTVITTGCQALTGATNVLPGSITASGSGSVVTIASVGALTAGQSYCAILNSASAVTNPATPGTYPVILTDGSDTATTTVVIVTNDQVVVSAVVPPTLTFALSGNTDAYTASLSPAALTTTTGVTATISTNANYGWNLWARSANAGLRSTSQSKTIASVATGSNTTMNGGTIGTEAYALGVTTANATAPYANAGGITGGGLSSTVFNQIATANAPATGSTVTIKELADISATTPAAADYSDTITLSAAGNY
jgi:hypothetical protein